MPTKGRLYRKLSRISLRPRVTNPGSQARKGIMMRLVSNKQQSDCLPLSSQTLRRAFRCLQLVQVRIQTFPLYSGWLSLTTNPRTRQNTAPPRKLRKRRPSRRQWVRSRSVCIRLSWGRVSRGRLWRASYSRPSWKWTCRPIGRAKLRGGSSLPKLQLRTQKWKRWMIIGRSHCCWWVRAGKQWTRWRTVRSWRWRTS